MSSNGLVDQKREEDSILDYTEGEIRLILWKANINNPSSFEDLLSLCSKFPMIDKVVDYDTGFLYYLQAKFILDEIKNITTNEPSKKEQFDIITNWFKEYTLVLDTHITTLKNKKNASQVVGKYEKNIKDELQAF